MKKTAYIINGGQINRTEHETSEESSLGQKTINNMGLEIFNKDLEGYKDAPLGTIVFNKTMVPFCDQDY